MSAVTVLHGVDETLAGIARAAVQPLNPRPQVTVGPLGAKSTSLRVNWWLYRVSPHPSFRTGPPPGRPGDSSPPPLALSLSYLLTAFPGAAGADQEQYSHTALAAVMLALHESPVIGSGSGALSPFARRLAEPLRVTLTDVDVETVTKLWAGAAAPMRLSVGYAVSLVVVDPTTTRAAGPPVRERRAHVVPTTGPRVRDVAPERAGYGVPLTLTVDGWDDSTVVHLPRTDDDPPGPAAWTLPAAPAGGGGRIAVQLPDPALAPGHRRLDLLTEVAGLPAQRASVAVVLAPVVRSHQAPARAGQVVVLTTAHAVAPVEAYVGGRAVPPSDVTVAGPTRVEVRLPADAAPGPAELVLRSAGVTGPPYSAVVEAP
jgi:hypothetical protein